MGRLSTTSNRSAHPRLARTAPIGGRARVWQRGRVGGTERSL